MIAMTAAIPAHNMCESCRFFRECVPTCARHPPIKTPKSLYYGAGRQWTDCEHVVRNYTELYVEARTKWQRFYAEDISPIEPKLGELISAAARDGSAAVGTDEACEAGSRTCAGFPRVVHQSWKTRELPAVLQEWRRTWSELNPGYTMRLWSDSDNDRFLAKHYPWFAKYYRQYDKTIKRVDAVRVFYLYHYGGVYADLDFACIRPFDELLRRHGGVAEVLLGELHVGRAASQSVPNALMISKPKAKFWLYVMAELVRRVNCETARLERAAPRRPASSVKPSLAHSSPLSTLAAAGADPMFDTGPSMLTAVARREGNASDSGLRLLSSSHFYSISWNQGAWSRVGRGDRINATAMSAAFARASALDPNTFAVTSWMHSWDYRMQPQELRSGACLTAGLHAPCAIVDWGSLNHPHALTFG